MRTYTSARPDSVDKYANQRPSGEIAGARFHGRLLKEHPQALGVPHGPGPDVKASVPLEAALGQDQRASVTARPSFSSALTRWQRREGEIWNPAIPPTGPPPRRRLPRGVGALAGPVRERHHVGRFTRHHGFDGFGDGL